MRTWGRIGEAGNPVTYDLNLPSWALSGLSITSGQNDPNGGTSAYLLTATGSNPAAFGPGIALPQNAGAYYSMQTLPNGTAWVTYTLDYLNASGTPIASDTISYNYATGAYDTSGSTNGAILTVLSIPDGWFQTTLTLPANFSGNVVGTQLELWPVGKGSYTTYGASSDVYAVNYSIVPSSWVKVDTDTNGYNDNVMLTTLAQVLKLNLGESPFYANYGIPQYQTITTQVFPDYYVMQTQTQFSQYFASLIITRVKGVTTPTYNIAAITHSGAILNATVAT